MDNQMKEMKVKNNSLTEAEINKYKLEEQISTITEQLKPIEKYLLDDDLSDIMINQNGAIFLDSTTKGMIETGEFIDEYQRDSMAKLLAGYNKKDITEENPIMSGKLPTGERIEIVTGEATNYQITFSIRKLSKKVFSFDEFVDSKTISPFYKEYLQKAIKEKKNIGINGGTGTGKTTLINTILKELEGTKDRIAIIEEVPELIVDKTKIKNLIKYITTNNVSGLELLKSLMRQRPDRIIYGELRWGHEVEVYLDAQNTGHKGGVFSLHANSNIDGVHRLEELLAEIPGKTYPRPHIVARGVDVMINIRRDTDADGRPRRYVDEIIEIKGYDREKKEYIYEVIEDETKDI